MLNLTFLTALGTLEFGLFVVGPLLQNRAGPGPANVFYILLRVLVIGTFAYFSVRRDKRALFGTLSMTGFLIFLDQVVFKSIWLMIEIKKNPSLWEGVDPKGAIFNSAFSYVVSLPMVLLLAFLGAMLALRKPKQKLPDGQ
jgi:hypothetical protein